MAFERERAFLDLRRLFLGAVGRAPAVQVLALLRREETGGRVLPLPLRQARPGTTASVRMMQRILLSENSNSRFLGLRPRNDNFRNDRNRSRNDTSGFFTK